MRLITPQSKVVIAILSLLLTFFVWKQGLEKSFERPSVAPQLLIKQQEIAVLAEPSLPQELKNVLAGQDQKLFLKETLSKIPLEDMEPRQRLLLASLEQVGSRRDDLLSAPINERDLKIVKDILLKAVDDSEKLDEKIKALQKTDLDPLLYRLSCLGIGGTNEICVDKVISQTMAFRLITSQGLPLISVLLGIGLIFRQAWRLFRKTNSPWPKITTIPLSFVDMVLLIAGGFVLLGEVFSPLISLPLIRIITSHLSDPLQESLKVFIGYVGMTIPPLFIFSRQLQGIESPVLPAGKWLQWQLSPLKKAFLDAFQGWLIVTPFVLLVSLVMNYFFGDPGGSNPLLEMVLMSKDFWALGIIFITTALLAPLFEEFLFRGVLLPVLIGQQGKTLAVVISAFVFALAHLSVGELPPLFVLGVGLALLRLSTGRLLPCVIMHSLWNGITFTNLVLLSS